MSALAEKLEELLHLNASALKAEWRRLFRSQPPSLSRDLIQRAIAYRYQEVALGGISKASARALRAVGDVANRDDKAPTKAPRQAIQPGARLIREWHGRTHSVTVTETGFEHAGRSYRSLTEIAKEITGAHWSGPRFFGLRAGSGAERRKDGTKLSSRIPLQPSKAKPVAAKVAHHG